MQAGVNWERPAIIRRLVLNSGVPVRYTDTRTEGNCVYKGFDEPSPDGVLPAKHAVSEQKLECG